MFKQRIERELGKALNKMGFQKPHDTFLYISEKPQFGDYSSNIALQLSKQDHKKTYQTPLEIANHLLEKLGHPEFLDRIEIAGVGFINFFIKDESLVRGVWDVGAIGQENHEPSATSHKQIIVEYCDPNTHKMLHIGHLLPLVLGEAMSRLYEYQGHEVIRTNYGSDIGLTVAKAIWGVREIGGIEEIREKSLREKSEFLGKAYAYAHGEYEKSLEVKEQIDQITNKLYQRDRSLIPLWEETKDWSLGYFEIIYSIFGTLFDRRINESEVDQLGKKIVLDNVGKVFIKDQGAIIFPGEKYNLHNRVFINSKGNPTYEGKDIGLQEKYQQLYQYDQVNIFSHKEQDDYFKVVFKANEVLFPILKDKIKHISYGEVRLPSGKMSSREGNVITADTLLHEVKSKIKTLNNELNEEGLLKLAVCAIKFAFLKYSVGSNIIYDIDESISIQGDTGLYVMYVYARIISLIKKSSNRANNFESENQLFKSDNKKIAQKQFPLQPEEREILRLIEYFEIIVEKSTDNFQPNEITKYLINISKSYNSFYEKVSILGSKQQDFRLLLSKKVAETIKLGFYLLGIETVEKM